MRRTIRALVCFVVAFVVLSLCAPAAANAADPVPGPIDEILDVPSRTVKSVAGSPMADQLVIDLWRAFTQRKTQTIPVGLPPADAKPLTAAKALTRGAGGPLLGAFTAGFMIGEGGLYLYSALDPTFDPLPGVCGTPLEVPSSLLYIGLMPDCTAGVTIPNTDQPLTTGPMTYQGGTVSYVKTYITTSGNRYHCYLASAQYRGYSNQWGSGASTVSIGTMINGTFQHISWFPSAAANPATSCSGTDQYWANASTPNPALVFRVGTSTSGYTYPAGMTQSQADPLRNPRCKITWPDGSVTMGNGQPYRESVGVPLTSTGTGCEQAYVSQPNRGPAFLPDRIQIDSETGGAITEIADQEVPDFSPDERRAFETGNGRGLVLEKIVGTLAKSCMTWESDCAGWWEATDEGTTPGTYRCTFAGNEIALAECGPYRHTFDSRTATPTITHPSTGAQVDWSAAPNTGNSLNPGVGPGTGASPAENCFATGWSSVANPVDWVMLPVKCALVWAFVPRAANVESGQDRIETNWRNSTLGQLAGTVAGVSVALEELGAGNCGGLIVGLPVPGSGGEMTIANHAFLPACPGDLFADVAPLVYWLFSGLLLVGGWAMTKKQVDNFVGNS